jgi:DNA-binding transcriptional ArsR family regulator
MSLERVVQLLERIDEKLGRLVEEHELGKLRKSTQRILNLLDNWTTTHDLARILGYRQEYVSRQVAALKRAKLVIEQRQGRRIFYKRTE